MNPLKKLKGKVLPEDNFLLYIPERKHLDFELKKGRVLLNFHHDSKLERFARWLVKKPLKSDVEFDELGSYVWKTIDGNKPVYEIAALLSDEFDSKAEQAQERLILFLRYLNKKGWIFFKRGAQ